MILMGIKTMQITESEWLIMKAIWKNEGCTSAEIVTEVQQEKNVSMRTVKTLIRRLIEKEAISFTIDEKDSRAYHYYSLVSKQQCLNNKSAAFAKLIYENNISSLLNHFLFVSHLSKSEIEELEKVLEKKKEGANNE